MFKYKSETVYNGKSYGIENRTFAGTKAEFLMYMRTVHGGYVTLADGRLKYVNVGLVSDIAIFVTLPDED